MREREIIITSGEYKDCRVWVYMKGSEFYFRDDNLDIDVLLHGYSWKEVI